MNCSYYSVQNPGTSYTVGTDGVRPQVGDFMQCVPAGGGTALLRGRIVCIQQYWHVGAENASWFAGVDTTATPPPGGF